MYIHRKEDKYHSQPLFFEKIGFLVETKVIIFSDRTKIMALFFILHFSFFTFHLINISLFLPLSIQAVQVVSETCREEPRATVP